VKTTRAKAAVGAGIVRAVGGEAQEQQEQEQQEQEQQEQE
jgi:hypothetical protein